MSNQIKNNELGYLGNPSVKRDGVESEFTKKEILEYKKCMESPVYFARTYVKVISLDDGLVPFDLYPYQEKMFNHFLNNRFSIVLACRQSGKSISSVVYLLWFAIFHPEKTIAILANKGAVAREMLARITLALENLPFFLQPGCKALNKGSIEFSNNSKIIASATGGNSIYLDANGASYINGGYIGFGTTSPDNQAEVTVVGKIYANIDANGNLAVGSGSFAHTSGIGNYSGYYSTGIGVETLKTISGAAHRNTAVG